MKKTNIIIGILVVVVVLGLGWFLSSKKEAVAPVPQASNEKYLTYTDPQNRFSVQYPADFSAVDNSFFVSPELSDGTNLSKDSKISVLIAPTSSCEAMDFFGENDQAVLTTSQKTVGGRTYNVAVFGDAGAGNYYETHLYAFKENDKCLGAELFIHSTNILNYEGGTIVEFDEEKLMNIFLELLQTIK